MVASSCLRSLPEDLLIGEILLRLPVKSLLRCKSVCKDWHTIISSPSFIKKHFNHERNLTHLVIYCDRYKSRDDHENNCSYSYFPDETLERHEVPDELLLWGEIIYLRGPCNGIFCIRTKNNKFVLWNPSTRRLRLVRCCPSYEFSEMGFGMDPVSGEFKIVLINSEHSVSSCFAIYTSSNDSWKYMEHESLSDSEARIFDFIPGSNTFLNGFYYWKKHKYGLYPEGPTYAILAFDMHNEIFQEIKMPETVGLFSAQLHLFNDSLALVCADPEFDDKRIEIWLLDGKECWTKFFSVVLPFEYLDSYGFWGGNSIIFTAYTDNVMELVMYDFGSRSARRLEVENVFVGSEILPIYYKESLFSVKGENGIQDYDTRSPDALEFLGSVGPKTTIDCSEC